VVAWPCGVGFAVDGGGGTDGEGLGFGEEGDSKREVRTVLKLCNTDPDPHGHR